MGSYPKITKGIFYFLRYVKPGQYAILLIFYIVTCIISIAQIYSFEEYSVISIGLSHLFVLVFSIWIYLYFNYVKPWYKYCKDMIVFRNKLYVSWINYSSFKKKLDKLIGKSAMDLSKKSHQSIVSMSSNEVNEIT